MGALPIVLEFLRDDDRKVQSQAVLSVQVYSPVAKEAVPSIIEIIRNGEYSERRDSIVALALIGQAAKETIPLLLEVAVDLKNSETIWVEARKSIVRIKRFQLS